MRRLARLAPWLGGLTGFACAVLLAGIGVLVFQDHNQYKAQLSEAFRLVTGRALRVDGAIRMRIGLTPTLIVENVSLANAGWGARRDMARFRRFEAKVALLPLLDGEVRVKHVDLFEGDIFLERDGEGRRNWDFEPGPDSAADDNEEAESLFLESLRIRDSTVTYLDRVARVRQRVSVDRLLARRPHRGSGLLEVDLTAAYEGRALSLKGRIGTQLYLATMPYAAPVDVALRLGSTRLTAKGLVGLPLDDERTDLRVTVEGPRLGAALAALHVHTDDERPFHVAGRLAVAKRRWVLSDMAASLGSLTVAGRVSVARSPGRSPVIARLHTPLLDLDALAPPPPRRARQGTRRWVFGRIPLPHDVLPALNLRLALHADRLTVGGFTLEEARLAARLDHGVLVIRGLRAGFLGGTVRGGIVLDGDRRPPRTVGRLELRDIDFGGLLARLDVTHNVVGRGDIDARLFGRGRTWREFVSSMSGDFDVAIGKGRVRGSYVDMLGADLLTSIAPWASSISDASLNCMVTQFRVERGIATARGLLFDTTRVTVAGKGTIDLRRERFDMKLMPRPKDPSLLSLAAPINLDGPLRDPSIYPDEFSIAKNVAGAVAGGLVNPLIVLVPLVDPGTGDENACVAALGKGRGRNGRRRMPVYDDRSFLERTIEDVGEGIGRGIMELFGE